MAFTIQSPNFANPVPLFRSKFALTVKGPPGQLGRLQAVLLDAGRRQVASAYPARDDAGAADRFRTFVLDLGDRIVQNLTFS
jgi:hypothetical protein